VLNLPNRVIAITGGIASGKTTYCKKLEEEGKGVIYSDKLTRKVYEKRSVKSYLEDIQCSTIGVEHILIEPQPHFQVLGEQELVFDFKRLREVAFKHPSFLKNILEPLIWDHFLGEFYLEYTRLGLNIPRVTQNSVVKVLEGELFWKDVYVEVPQGRFMAMMRKKFDQVIELDAPEEERVQRIIKRDRCSEEVARLMIERQKEYGK